MKARGQSGRVRGSVVFGAALLLALAGLIWLGDGVPEVLGRGDAAPLFDLPRLASTVSDGDPRIALEDLRGKVVLVNFWATWCKPCEDEMPAMQTLYEALNGRAFELVAVSVDETAAEVEEFQERMALQFPIVLDPDQEVSAAYQTMGFPESILVGADGRVVERYVGPRDWDAPAHRRRIEKLIESASGGG